MGVARCPQQISKFHRSRSPDTGVVHPIASRANTFLQNDKAGTTNECAVCQSVIAQVSIEHSYDLLFSL